MDKAAITVKPWTHLIIDTIFHENNSELLDEIKADIPINPYNIYKFAKMVRRTLCTFNRSRNCFPGLNHVLDTRKLVTFRTAPISTKRLRYEKVRAPRDYQAEYADQIDDGEGPSGTPDSEHISQVSSASSEGSQIIRKRKRKPDYVRQLLLSEDEDSTPEKCVKTRKQNPRKFKKNITYLIEPNSSEDVIDDSDVDKIYEPPCKIIVLPTEDTVDKGFVF